MVIGYPYTETGMLNLKNYQVISTDYKTFALVWRCQPTLFGHRKTAQILSRTKSLSKEILEELQTSIRHIELRDNYTFNTVRQTDCECNIETSDSKNKSGSKKTGLDKDDPFRPPFININSGSKMDTGNKQKKKLLSIDVGGFHLSISLPFF